MDQLLDTAISAEHVDDAASPLTAKDIPANPSSRHTADCVLSVRALLHERFKLPAEIISSILDYGAHWVCTTTVMNISPGKGSLMGAGNKLLTTNPLGQYIASLRAEAGPLVNCVQERTPCRRIIVTVRAKAHRRPQDCHGPMRYQFSGCTKYWQIRSPRNNPIVMSVLWGDGDADEQCSPHRKSRNEVFSPDNVQTVLTANGKQWPKAGGEPVGWSIAVVEQALSRDEMEDRVMMWDWTDESAGGDLVRALMVGDELRLAASPRVFGWRTLISFLQVKVFNAL